MRPEKIQIRHENQLAVINNFEAEMAEFRKIQGLFAYSMAAESLFIKALTVEHSVGQVESKYQPKRNFPILLASRKPAKPLAFQKEPYNAGHIISNNIAPEQTVRKRQRLALLELIVPRAYSSENSM